ncbi:MAG: beta-ketoacyl synthase N-terminal-like domain-containing protein, partial [Acidobacteriota bacterium]
MNESYPLDQHSELEIAIIGLAGRFPKANNITEFWQNLCNGVEAISFFSEQELVSAGISTNLLKHPNYVKANGALENIDLFDAGFFGFNPREAQILDPQQRLFLECAWEALEDAGYNAETFKGRIGVYAGISISSYLFNLYSNPDIIQLVGPFQAILSNDKDFLATRVSYKFNLKGPSVNIQTSCSTSLVTVHLACQSLLNGECDMALVGGVSIAANQKTGYLYQDGGIYSPDGHCRAFDAKAKGTVAGNGLGIVVLKRLVDAIDDKDHIYAVIKGSAVNNDGAVKVGYTAPSIDGQAEVISEAQAMARVDANTITYIETHGTGTPLGDPIEIAALTQAFRASTDACGFCALGAVKTNVGHLDAAAGITGLIKAVLMLYHKQIPPSLNFTEANPQIDFANSPFYVNTRLSDWSIGNTPRRAGVSSFGMGGTNAHVVLEEFIPTKENRQWKPVHILVLSAKTRSALDKAIANLATHLNEHPQLEIANVAYTLQVGRKPFSHRCMLICHNVEEAVSTLVGKTTNKFFSRVQETTDRPVVFMFTGQGSQYVNMGQELYQTEPIFRDQIDFCSQYLEHYLKLDLRTLLYPINASEEDYKYIKTCLNQTSITQPALFVIEYALAKLWMQWGIKPYAMIGHSIGEYVAACLAGVFSLEDALKLVALRGRLMQDLPPGDMLAVPLSETDLQHALNDNLSLAAVNGPTLCVVSGVTDSVRQLEYQLIKQGIECRPLITSHAFHSQMVEPILDRFNEQVKAINLASPQIPYISNLTGSWISESQVTDSNYWVRHLRETVRFAEGIQELLKEKDIILLEVGPGQTLSSLAKLQTDREQVIFSSLPHTHDKQSESEFLHTTLGKLWLAGAPVNWSKYQANNNCCRLSLPTYPFERQHYWIERQRHTSATRGGITSLRKKDNITEWFYIPSRKLTLPLRPIRPGTLDQRSNWLIFLDGSEFAAKLATRLEQEGQQVVMVKIGTQFSYNYEGIYTINPQQPEDYYAILRELSKSGKQPHKIIHCWTLFPSEEITQREDFFYKCQQLGCYSLLFLVQALAKQATTDEIQLEIISNDLFGWEGSICPEKTTLLGPCKVIPQEYQNIICRTIDIIFSDIATSQSIRLIDHLINEICTKTFDPVVAYRGNQRWVQTFEPVSITHDAQPVIELRMRGVYLITGGLGDVGFLIAEHLAKTYQSRLVLIGRSKLPPREEWQQWLFDHNEQNRINRKIERLQRLEKLGAEVLVISADVAIEEQMSLAIAQAYQHFGQLNGVLHAAVTKDSSISSLIPEVNYQACEAQFRPKVYGLYVLERVLRGREIDFCLLFSSNAAILGGIGFTVYSAANLFMDAFAINISKTGGIPWISANWDGWLPPDEAKPSRALHTSIEQYSMTVEESLDAFERVIAAAPTGQIVVSTGDLFARHNLWIRRNTLTEKESIEKNSTLPTLHSRPVLDTIYLASRNELEQTIANLWQELLGIEQIGINDNFFELGGNSLLATQVISRIHKIFQVELPLRKYFEASTVAELAEKISPLLSTKQLSLTSNITPVSRDRRLPLSYAQQRLWVIEQLGPGSGAYNIATGLRLNGNVDITALIRS